MRLNRLLRKVRGERSRSSVAKDVGCSYQHIYDIETGEASPSVDLAEKLARVLGAPEIATSVLSSEVNKTKKKLVSLEKRLATWQKKATH